MTNVPEHLQRPRGDRTETASATAATDNRDCRPATAIMVYNKNNDIYHYIKTLYYYGNPTQTFLNRYRIFIRKNKKKLIYYDNHNNIL